MQDLNTHYLQHKYVRNIFKILLVLVFYAVIAIIVTWPLINHISTHLPDRFNDALLHSWNTWWVRTALANGQSPLFTNYIFFPNGASLITTNMAWFHIAQAIVFGSFLNATAAYNASVLFTLTLCGASAFWLTYRLTGNAAAALLGGLIYLAWPYRVARLDLPNLLATQWIPIFFLFLIYTTRWGRWRDAIITGTLFALIGYTRWQLLLPATIMSLIYFTFSIPSLIKTSRRYIFVRLITAAGIAMLLLIPPMITLVNQFSGEDLTDTIIREGEEALMSADLLAFITPSEHNFIFGDHTRSLYEKYYEDRDTNRRRPAFIGFSVLFLATSSFVFQRRKTFPWVTMAIILFSLSLGPVLRINGQFFENIPTLYRLLEPLRILSLMRDPERFTMFLALPLTVLSAYGVAGLMNANREKLKQMVMVLPILLGILIFLEFFSPQTIFEYVSSTNLFYEKLAQEPDKSALINLPFGDHESIDYMYNQLIHERPIIQGNLSRMPDGVYSYVDNNNLLRVLRWIGEIEPRLVDVSRQMDTLAADGISYIILHKDKVEEENIKRLEKYFLTQPIYEDETIAVYTTEPKVNRDFELKPEFSPGLGIIDTVISATCLNPGRFLELDIGWGARQAAGVDYDVVISLVDQQGKVQQKAHYQLSDRWPTSEWPSNAIAWGWYPIALDPSLPNGKFQIHLELFESDNDKHVIGETNLGIVTVQENICPFGSDPLATDVGVFYGRDLQLQEYELEQFPDRLELKLFWRSEKRMDQDYKVFVHVFDPKTNIPIAQNDSMPRYGSYPTSFWWPGEELVDLITISLEDIPAGKYGIAVGVYLGETGQRLPLVNHLGHSLADDGRFILEEMVEIN